MMLRKFQLHVDPIVNLESMTLVKAHLFSSQGFDLPGIWQSRTKASVYSPGSSPCTPRDKM